MPKVEPMDFLERVSMKKTIYKMAVREVDHPVLAQIDQRIRGTRVDLTLTQTMNFIDASN